MRARSRRGCGTCRHRAPARCGRRRARRRGRRNGSVRAAARAGRSRRSAAPLRPLRLLRGLLGRRLDRDAGRNLLRLRDLGLRGDLRLFVGDSLGLGLFDLDGFDLGLLGLGGRAGDVVAAGALERLVRGNAAEARAGQRGVRAALAVGEDGGAAAGEVLRALFAAAEGRLGLGLGELGVRLGVDLPPGEACGEAGVHALLADRERKLVVGDDDRRLARLVVEVDLAHTRGRERLRDEPGRLRVPRDDVDLLAAELGHDHADARAARPDAGADGVDALRVRLDRDLRAVAGLARDAPDLDEPVGDLRHLELEQRLDQLRVAAREDHLRPLRARPDLGDHRLDPRALLVALAVDLLGARQERLDLAEVDEHVVAVARLLDDPRHHLADAVDVLLVHHLPLGLPDPLEDHLLRRLGGDPAEVLRRDVLAPDLVLRDLRPVEDEVVVGEQGVVLLARLLLDPLELLERALARLLEEALLELARQLDRVDAEVARLVELDGGVAGRARRLLVGGEQRVLERGHERPGLDPLLALDLADGVDDLLCHLRFPTLRRSGWPARSPRTGCRPARRRGGRAGGRARRRRPPGRAGARSASGPAPGARARVRSARACGADARAPARRPRPCSGRGTAAARA